MQVGWVIREGVVSIKPVRDWEDTRCARHICEVQIIFGKQYEKIDHVGYVQMRDTQHT